VDCLVDLCGRAPVLARNTTAATVLMEQASMAGHPVRLIFLDLPFKDTQSVQDYACEIRTQVDLLRNASIQAKVTVILLTSDGGLRADLDNLMDVAGLYAILGLPPVPDFLNNLLHAHLIDLDRSNVNVNTRELQATSTRDPGPLIASTEHHGYEILVAEDNPTNRKVLQRILERAGHRCVLVKDGEEALDAVDKRTFDAIVLDMNMPLVAGTDVARLCRLMHGQSARIPIIMFSANVTPEARRESMQAGADEFLPKPIQVDTFLRTLDRLVEDFHGSVPGLGKKRASTPSRPVLLIDEEPVLNPVALEGIEKMSHDPKFLDDLIVEFIKDNKQLLDSLEQTMLAQTWERFWEIVHALKGSALSVGATSMKMACRRLEKIDPVVIAVYSHEINTQLRKIFTMLCEELERYRQQRVQRFYE
jgi:CheY-like chemotaxis protein/HPt (histidine-containing phosphotransfer) domain-containing protein